MSIVPEIPEMPAFDRVRKEFLKKLEESKSPVSNNFEISLQTEFSSFLLTSFGFNVHKIRASLNNPCCYQSYSESNLDYILFNENLLDFLYDLFEKSNCAINFSNPHHFNFNTELNQELLNEEFEWPLLDMAEYEFSSINRNMKNVVILINLPIIQQTEMYKLESIIKAIICDDDHEETLIELFFPTIAIETNKIGDGISNPIVVTKGLAFLIAPQKLKCSYIVNKVNAISFLWPIFIKNLMMKDLFQADNFVTYKKYTIYFKYYSQIIHKLKLYNKPINP